MKFKLFLFFSLITLSFLACNRDDYNASEETSAFTDYLEELTVNITNIYNVPLNNVMVEVGEQSALTNELGNVKFENAVSNEDNVFKIKAKRENYAPMYYNLKTSGDVMNISARIAATGSFTFPADEIAFYEVDDAIFTHEPNSLVTSSGNSYSGTVTAKYVILTPSQPNFSELVPGGDFLGVDQQGEIQYLSPISVIYVTFFDEEGNKLQLGNNKRFRVTIKIPEELEYAANISLPIWYFDEENHAWQEYEKINNNQPSFNQTFYLYELGWWTFATPQSVNSQLSGQLLDCIGNTLDYASLQINNQVVQSNYNGFLVDVPTGEPLVISFPNNAADTIFVEPLMEGEIYDIGEIKLCTDNDDNFYNAWVEGTVIGCDGNPIEGYRVWISSGKDVYTDANGYFKTGVKYDAYLSVAFYNDDNVYEHQSFDNISFGETINIGQISPSIPCTNIKFEYEGCNTSIEETAYIEFHKPFFTEAYLHRYIEVKEGINSFVRSTEKDYALRIVKNYEYQEFENIAFTAGGSINLGKIKLCPEDGFFMEGCNHLCYNHTYGINPNTNIQGTRWDHNWHQHLVGSPYNGAFTIINDNTYIITMGLQGNLFEQAIFMTFEFDGPRENIFPIDIHSSNGKAGIFMIDVDHGWFLKNGQVEIIDINDDFVEIYFEGESTHLVDYFNSPVQLNEYGLMLENQECKSPAIQKLYNFANNLMANWSVQYWGEGDAELKSGYVCIQLNK